MKVKNILLLISSVQLLHVRGAEPFDSYLNGLVQGAGDNLWWVHPKKIQGQTITPPKGGYILRIKMDVNGDGVDEVFLTTDDEAMKGGTSWTLYRGTSSGNYVKLDENVWFRDDLWRKAIGGITKYSYLGPPDEDTGLEDINTFWIDMAGNYQTSTQSLTEAQSKAVNGGDKALLDANGLPDDSKIAEFLNLGTRVTFAIEKVLLGKFFQNANTPWRSVNSSYALSQQYLDPADAADIASLATWTPPSNP